MVDPQPSDPDSLGLKCLTARNLPVSAGFLEVARLTDATEENDCREKTVVHAAAQEKIRSIFFSIFFSFS